jgi:hypothetical protein
MRLKLVVFLLASASAALAQGAPAARYDLIFENDKVAAFRLDLAARQRAPVYQNTHEILWIALDTSAIRITLKDRPDIRLALAPGDVRFFRSFQTKEIVNDAAGDFHGVLIQIKTRGLTWNGCDCLGRVEQAICGCRGAGPLPSLWAVGLGGVTVGGTTLAAGQAFLGASLRGDTLLLALTPLDLVDQAAASPLSIRLRPGEVRWLPRSSHKFQNLGEAPARYVTVEF